MPRHERVRAMALRDETLALLQAAAARGDEPMDALRMAAGTLAAEEDAAG